MQKKLLVCLLFTTILFGSTLFCHAKEIPNKTESYPSYIEEYDELYFLENIYMEEIYYEHYYSQNKNFQRIDLSEHEFAQSLRLEIEQLYHSQQDGIITISLQHTTDLDYQEYVDIVMNTYIEFIKSYQYQETIIQPDFTTCYFKPYEDLNNANIFYTDISIHYINY